MTITTRSLLTIVLLGLALLFAIVGWRQVGAQDDATSAEITTTTTNNNLAPDANLSSAISYQGQLNSSGAPANGTYDFKFTLYDAQTGGSIAGFATFATLTVTDGIFNADNLIFGDSAFTGKALWLEVEVRSSGSSIYTKLTPRQRISGAPYAVGIKPGARIVGAFSNNGLYFEDTATSGVTSGVYAYSRNPTGRALRGEQNSSGVAGSAGVYGRANAVNSAGVMAENTVDYGLDLVLAGTSNTGLGDDGRIGSDPRYAGSDIMMVSNDGIFLYLDSNGNEAGEFVIFDDNDQTRLNFTESAELSLYDDAGVETVEIAASEGDTGGQIILRDDAGNATITLDAEFGNGGDGRITTEIVEITGGSDLSEQFNVSGDVQPGMVVSIDADVPGQLVISSEAYDRKVAGIVSGAGGIKPGLLMGQHGSVADGEHPIALTGRVYVWADASNGAIEAGDLLTTSSLPGFAMRVSDYGQAQGAIIGKAMQSLDQGQGLILVLVTLQ